MLKGEIMGSLSAREKAERKKEEREVQPGRENGEERKKMGL